jgi:ribosomal protein S18 acetylase RimI-like enzyme
VPPWTIRRATADDAEVLLALWAESAHGRSISDDAASVTHLVGHPTTACFVATVDVDRRVVGSVIAGWDGWRASLYRLAVAADHRRQGLARALVETAERFATDLGATRVDAMVDAGNDDGVRFWEEAGYRRNPRYVRFEKRYDSS